MTVYGQGQGSLFTMTSGLRSLRDKTLTYFEEALTGRTEPFDRLFKAVNAFADQLRQVSREDKEALVESGLSFDFYALIGGQLQHDHDHLLYLVYPQGNWIEVGKGTPYQIIVSPAYGKPVLDRTLQYMDSLRFALKVGCLAFDSTRISAADVDYPIDVVIYAKNSYPDHRAPILQARPRADFRLVAGPSAQLGSRAPSRMDRPRFYERVAGCRDRGNAVKKPGSDPGFFILRPHSGRHRT